MLTGSPDMSPRSLLLNLTAWCLALPVFATEVPPGKAVPAAEEAARSYMTAFFHGDLETAAALTDPETLGALRSAVMSRLEETRPGEGARARPADFGLSHSVEELKALTARAFYVEVLAASRQADAAFADAMKETVVEVDSSRRTPDGLAIVQLQVITYPGEAASNQKAALLMREADSKWKVLREIQ